MQSPSTSSCILDDFRCRLCFTSSDINLQPLFPPGEDCFVNDLLSRIYDCLDIHFSFLEDFCSVICTVCREKINSFYNFKKQCQSNDRYLRENRSRQPNGVDLERMSRFNRDPPDVGAFQDKVDEPQEEVMLSEDKEKEPQEEAELEKMSGLNSDQLDVGAFQGKVEEPQEEVMLSETKNIFFPVRPTPNLAVASKVGVGVQISGTSSSESFRGFLTESCSRRSLRNVIKKSTTEAFEMISDPSVPMDDIPECHISLVKLDNKPTVLVQDANAIVCYPIARGKHRKQNKTEQVTKNEQLPPRLFRKKAVLNSTNGGSELQNCRKGKGPRGKVAERPAKATIKM